MTPLQPLLRRDCGQLKKTYWEHEALLVRLPLGKRSKETGLGNFGTKGVVFLEWWSKEEVRDSAGGDKIRASMSDTVGERVETGTDRGKQKIKEKIKQKRGISTETVR